MQLNSTFLAVEAAKMVKFCQCIMYPNNIPICLLSGCQGDREDRAVLGQRRLLPRQHVQELRRDRRGRQAATQRVPGTRMAILTLTTPYLSSYLMFRGWPLLELGMASIPDFNSYLSIEPQL